MIRKEMTILDIICDHQETQEVFRKYDAVSGECVMCNHMFETLEEFSVKYHLDCETLLSQLRSSIV